MLYSQMTIKGMTAKEYNTGMRGEGQSPGEQG